ncbi:MAG: VWA domain-containing protein [Cyanobacteria bacterium J06638_22]
MSKSAPLSTLFAIASFALMGVGVIGCALWLLRQQTPISSYLIVDVSESMRDSGQLEDLSHQICIGIQEQTISGDSFTVMPFANTSAVTHAVEIQNRLDVLGLCKGETLTALLEAESVAAEEGTSLHDTLAHLQQHVSIGGQDEQGRVISILIHANDQGVGAHDAIAIAETAQLAESLLTEGTVLVLFAVESDLQRDLQSALQHPHVRVSALSPESIETSLVWAFSTARNTQGE